MRLLTRNDILGARIRRIFEIPLPIDGEFQPSDLIAELDSGLQLSFQQKQEIAVDPSKPARIECSNVPITVQPTMDQDKNPELKSPIAGLFLPFGWERCLGFVLKNGFVLHEGFSLYSNGVMFYHPAESTSYDFIPLILPD